MLRVVALGGMCVTRRTGIAAPARDLDGQRSAVVAVVCSIRHMAKGRDGSAGVENTEQNEERAGAAPDGANHNVGEALRQVGVLDDAGPRRRGERGDSDASAAVLYQRHEALIGDGVRKILVQGSPDKPAADRHRECEYECKYADREGGDDSDGQLE